ncbi:YbaB/EbfC family nucleoid-associated protein [Parvularcula sp. IMCC14364]|uniref:YbaB/EbfC family nucleoid-associated protein n=1 Tax=Parvularcula sp. IMCC14364 TaxID=3067902 RepID=UPI002740D174|nr:YbaB/EbfC family nucleoid-associated protein [Parvularcula sp. IMCC14364]
MMKGFGDMMKQAASLQGKMQEVQEKIAAMEADGVAGGGMVRVTLNGKGYASKVSIEKDLINPDEGEVLEDLIAAAINDAKSKLEEVSQEEMKSLTEGLPLPPGMKMPF